MNIEVYAEHITFANFLHWCLGAVALLLDLSECLFKGFEARHCLLMKVLNMYHKIKLMKVND